MPTTALTAGDTRHQHLHQHQQRWCGNASRAMPRHQHWTPRQRACIPHSRPALIRKRSQYTHTHRKVRGRLSQPFQQSTFAEREHTHAHEPFLTAKHQRVSAHGTRPQRWATSAPARRRTCQALNHIEHIFGSSERMVGGRGWQGGTALEPGGGKSRKENAARHVAWTDRNTTSTAPPRVTPRHPHPVDPTVKSK